MDLKQTRWKEDGSDVFRAVWFSPAGSALALNRLGPCVDRVNQP